MKFVIKSSKICKDKYKIVVDNQIPSEVEEFVNDREIVLYIADSIEEANSVLTAVETAYSLGLSSR